MNMINIAIADDHLLVGAQRRPGLEAEAGRQPRHAAEEAAAVHTLAHRPSSR